MTLPTETALVQLTPAAAEVVRQLLKERNLDESYALRLYIAGRTCSGLQYGMALDNNPSSTDLIFECEGIKLLVDDQSIEYLRGAQVDFIDDARGKGFLVENPNALPSCSCESGSCGL
ncbi:MAG: iron-sulfur cluster assembly accessory protein [Anaerolineales bacterium]